MARTKREKYPYIGKRLKDIREELKMTQDDLANEVHSSQMAISYMESGVIGKVMLDVLIYFSTQKSISASWVITPNNSKINKYYSEQDSKKLLQTTLLASSKKLSKAMQSLTDGINDIDKIQKMAE